MRQSANRYPVIADIHPKSPISEAYRVLRTNIEFSSVDRELKTIAVTSVGPGEGKTVTAANLAVTYAQADKNVLLIDADLRKPSLHRVFGQSNRNGLTHLLTNRSHYLDAIKETGIGGLSLLPSGPVPPNPSEMLSSRRMAALLEELRERFDTILFDTPPALAVTDAQIVAAICDGVLLVVDDGKVKREAARKAKANLERVKARILGVVLNKKNRKAADSYYYSYGNAE